MASGVACVLFTDLVGSTELMARLGDVAFDALRTEHFACLREAVAAAGGTEVKTTGDGLLATFPSASEGLAGAVAVQQTTDRQARRTEVALSIRAGLAFGEVSWENDDVFGIPVVEAARLVAAARPGQILCTALVRMVAGSRVSAAVTDVGSLELKGLPDPVAVCAVAWEPLGETSPPVPLPPLLAGVGRIFVGRDDELERAQRLWKEVSGDGGRRLFLLAGEPGIGKTRLATELARTVHEHGAMVLAGRCDEDLGVPYQPFVEALRHYVTHAAQPRLGRYGGELARLVPEVRERLPELPEALHSDPESERYRLFDAMAGWLADVSAESPVLLLFDDLHWAAKPTLLLLRHVLRSAEPLRLLVVVTYRDTDIGRGDPLTEFLADLRRERVGERVPLLGLDRAGVGAFLEAAAGHELPEDERDELSRAVWEETEGNPFFVAEVLRHLAETGGFEEREGRWVMTAPVEQLGIPEGVRDVVGRRLSRLPEGADRILAVAAVAGLEFEPPVVAAAGACTDEDLFAALEAAAAARLLVEVTGGARFRFSHALVRATLYDEISGPRRVALHRKMAESIESIHGHHLDDYLPALAHHWARASAPAAQADRAVDYATRAGDRALAQLAHDEAATYYHQALELLNAAGLADHARHQELLISLGEAQRRAGDPAHRETLLAAAGLAQARGDVEGLSRAALANTRGWFMSAIGKVDDERVAVLRAAAGAGDALTPSVRARILGALALELIYTGDRDARVALSDEALAIARRLDEPETLARVLLQRYFTAHGPGTLAERLDNTAELVALCQAIHDPTLTSLALLCRVRAIGETGDMDMADRLLEESERTAEETGQPTLRWATGLMRTIRVIMTGHIEEGERRARAVFELGQTTGQRDAAAFLAGQIFQVRYEQGRLAELEDQIADAAKANPALPAFQGYLALLRCEAGDLDGAREPYERLAVTGFALPQESSWILGITNCAAVCAHLRDRPRAPVIHRLLQACAGGVVFTGGGAFGSVDYFLGLLSGVTDEFEEAESRFAVAVEMNDRIGAPAWLARTWMEWAAVLLRRARPDDAYRAGAMLDQALTTAAELGLGGIERRARQLIAEGGGR